MMPTISLFILALGVTSSCLAQSNTGNNSYLQLTAIVPTAKNISAFECWQFTDPVTIDNNKGTSGAQIFTMPKGVKEIRYSVFPPAYGIGSTTPHNPPAAQVVAQLSGMAHVTLPVPYYGNRTLDEAWISGGAHGFFLALDPEGAGHITEWPADEATVTLQMPFASLDDLPAHELLHVGPCAAHRGGYGQIVDPVTEC